MRDVHVPSNVRNQIQEKTTTTKSGHPCFRNLTADPNWNCINCLSLALGLSYGRHLVTSDTHTHTHVKHTPTQPITV